MNIRCAVEMGTLVSARCLGRAGELVAPPSACWGLVGSPLEGVRVAGRRSVSVGAWLERGPASARHTVAAGELAVEEGEQQLPELHDLLKRHVAMSREWQRPRA